MNKVTTILVGAAVGAVVGHFVGSVIVEIIRIKERDYHDTEEFPQGDDLEESRYDQFRDMETYVRQGKGPMKSKKLTNYSKRYTGDVNRPDIADLVAKYNGEEEEKDPVEDNTDVIEGRMVDDENEFETPEDEKEQDIAIISLDDYVGDESGFDSVTLHYYEDDVVTDEQDNPIDRPEQIIGDDALVAFGYIDDDEDVVYVRNTPKKAIYEILRLNKEYGMASEKRDRLLEKKRLRQGGRPDRIDQMGEEEYHGEDDIS